MKLLKVKSKVRDYTVEFKEAFSEIKADSEVQSSYFIVDKNVYDLYREDFDLLGSSFLQSCYFIDALECNKNILYAEKLIQDLLKNGIKRNSVLIAIGGGITQDLCCFIATVLFRGVEWKFYPTTLLAQCDSCVGSKSSINVGSYKNQIGSFYPPSKIIIDSNFIKTLEVDDVLSGLGEAIKVHLLDPISGMNDLIFQYYDGAKNNAGFLSSLIYSSLVIKKNIVEIDEFDKEFRNIMNYGHTFGHAIESVTNYKIPHGIAVTLGMGLANHISMKLGLLSKKEHDKMKVLIRKNSEGHSFTLKSREEDYWSALRRDKKNVDDKIACILTDGIGKMRKVPLDLNAQAKKWISDYFVGENESGNED